MKKNPNVDVTSSAKCVKISMRKVSKTYSEKSRLIHALDNLNLDVFEGEIFCIVGASGSGKTTILNIIAGFISCTYGEILVNGRPIQGPSQGRVMIFQEDATFPWRTIWKNVLYGIEHSHRSSTSNLFANVEDLLKIAGLDGRKDSFPKELSGGMKKRLEIVRAFAVNPEIVLADEPFGGIDAITKEELQDMILKLWESRKNTIVVATHDIEDALYLGDRIAVLSAPPANLKTIIKIPFHRPRKLELKATEEFQQLRSKVKNQIEIKPYLE